MTDGGRTRRPFRFLSCSLVLARLVLLVSVSLVSSLLRLIRSPSSRSFSSRSLVPFARPVPVSFPRLVLSSPSSRLVSSRSPRLVFPLVSSPPATPRHGYADHPSPTSRLVSPRRQARFSTTRPTTFVSSRFVSRRLSVSLVLRRVRLPPVSPVSRPTTHLPLRMPDRHVK